MMDDRRNSFPEFELKAPERTRGVVRPMEDMMRIDKDSIWHSQTELDALYELAYGLHDTPGTQGHIIHCGIHRGGSICVMGAGARDSRSMLKPVIGIDPYYNSSYEGRDGFWNESYRQARENIHHFGLADYICPIIFEDTKLFGTFRIPTRITFIDTTHLYEHTKEEIQLLVPNLVDNGWLVFHDYSSDYEVIPAVNEFIDNQTDYELSNYHLDLKYSTMLIMQVKRHGR